MTDFSYYGALLDPELSNLNIFTAAIGIRPTRKSSIELVYHRYLQHRASDSLRDSELGADPTGRSRSLGSETDLVIGFQEIPRLDVKVVLGYFMPGRAFSTDDALFANVEMKYEF